MMGRAGARVFSAPGAADSASCLLLREAGDAGSAASPVRSGPGPHAGLSAHQPEAGGLCHPSTCLPSPQIPCPGMSSSEMDQARYGSLESSCRAQPVISLLFSKLGHRYCFKTLINVSY